MWDVGNSKMEGKAGASWGGISSSLRSCHATLSFLPFVAFLHPPPLFFILGDQGADSGAEENSKRAEKQWREEGSPRMFLFSPAM